jgi:NADH dehydrogenase (ubiquinone) 1 alpha/beta subcomplex 1
MFRAISSRILRPSYSVRVFSSKAPLSVQQVEDRVMEVLRNFDKVNKEKLTLDAHFINDLGLDSLDQVI